MEIDKKPALNPSVNQQGYIDKVINFTRDHGSGQFYLKPKSGRWKRMFSHLAYQLYTWAHFTDWCKKKVSGEGGLFIYSVKS